MGFFGNNMWKTVANYLTPQIEKKLNETHKSFSHMPNVYENVSENVIGELNPLKTVPWRFFEHSESGKLFAENVGGRDGWEHTVLHRAALKNLPKITKALIEAKVNLNAKTWNGLATALHIAVIWNHLEIGKMLIDARADLNVKNRDQRTPLDLATILGDAEFVKMINKM